MPMDKGMTGSRVKSESTSRSVVSSTFFSLVARVFSFVQAMIVSAYFGATKSTDFLFFCVSFTTLLPGLFSNINQSVLIPNSIRIRENKSEEESRKFMLSVYLFYLILGVAACAVINAVPEEFLALTSKFSRADIRENMQIAKLIIPTFFFILTNSYLLNVFDSYHYFTFPMILDMLKSALIIFFILLLGKRYGVASMAAGILIAHIIQFALLNISLVRLLGFRFQFKWYRLEKDVRKNIFFAVISQIASTINQYVVIYLISGLNEGVYTALSYSDRLYSIFVAVFTGQVSTVLGINMIEMYAKGQFDKLNRQYMKYIKVTMTLIIPLCFILAVQAPLVISILFGRGNFGPDSVELTAVFFRYCILLVPMLLIDTLNVRLVIAKQILHVSFIWNVICKGLSCIVLFVIIHYMDYRYYGLGLLLIQFVYMLLNSAFMVKQQFHFISVYKSLLYFICSSLLCFGLCFGLSAAFPAAGTVGLLAKTGILCAYSVLVFAGYYAIGFTTFNREAILLLCRYAAQFMPERARARFLGRNDLFKV